MSRFRAAVLLLAGAVLAGPSPTAAQAPTTATVKTDGGDVTIIADRLEQLGPDNLLVATGNVEIAHGTSRMLADRVEINRETGDATAQGNVIFYDGERMERLGERVYRVRRGVFTTCEEDTPAWSFKFGEATADLDELIYGTNVSFWLRDLPLIPFLPFFAAALRRERQTGFLPPSFGPSTRKGFFT